MSDCLEVYIALDAMLRDLLSMARAEAWDDLLEVLPRYYELTGRMQLVNTDAFSQGDRDSFESLLRELQNMQNELTERTQSWRDELAASLQGLHNAVKIDKAYR